MRSTALRCSWLATAIVLTACAPELPEMESGHTTTTYGGTNRSSSSSSNDGDPSDGTDVDSGGTVPPDPTDSGPDTADSGPPPILDLPPEPGLPNGATCTYDDECSSGNCYITPFLGGQCGECNEDADCVGGGCTLPNPFASFGSHCNMGELGGGCESDTPCDEGLECATAFDLLGLIQLTSCSACLSDFYCSDMMMICAPLVDVSEFSGYRDYISPNSLPQDSYCDMQDNGNQACASGICSTIDIMGLAQMGACGECNVDADCGGGTCVAGEFILETGTLTGSTCQ